MDDYTRYLNKKLENEEFRKEWEKLEAESQIMKEILKARIDTGMTQQQLFQNTDEYQHS